MISQSGPDYGLERPESGLEGPESGLGVEVEHLDAISVSTLACQH